MDEGDDDETEDDVVELAIARIRANKGFFLDGTNFLPYGHDINKHAIMRKTA